MELNSRYPYWLILNGLPRIYPSVKEDLDTEVAIIGAGITGAILAYYFHQAGLETLVVDKGNVGMGSTAASTALIQYEIDRPLGELCGLIGRERALRSYRLCLDAVGQIGRISKWAHHDTYRARPSFQFASVPGDRAGLYEEYLLRLNQGFPVRWLEEKEIRDKFHFSSTGGILSGVGAELDPYLFTHDLLARLHRQGLRVFDGTRVVGIRIHKGKAILRLASGKNIRAKSVVIACGYAARDFLGRSGEHLQNTYAIISEPGAAQSPWYRSALIWETARPYLYLRATADHRIIIGGKDSAHCSPAKRDSLVGLKARALEKSFNRMMPDVPFKTDFAWGGVFGSSKDGLPFIGSAGHRKQVYFALGFGGNGITFSVLAGQILSRVLQGKNAPDLDLFGFNR